MISKTAILKWILSPEGQRTMMFVLLGLFIFLFFNQRGTIQDLEQENQRQRSNINALSSELTEYELENKTLITERGAFQAEIDDLESMNQNLARRVRELEEIDPWSLINLDLVSDLGARRVDSDVKQIDEEIEITWSDSTSGNWGFRYLRGRHSFIFDGSVRDLQSFIEQDLFSLNISTGFRETSEGYLQVYATTDAPHVRFSNVEGAIIDPRQFVDPETPRWVIGPSLTVGVDSDFKFRPIIGVSLTYPMISR